MLFHEFRIVRGTLARVPTDRGVQDKLQTVRKLNNIYIERDVFFSQIIIFDLKSVVTVSTFRKGQRVLAPNMG